MLGTNAITTAAAVTTLGVFVSAAAAATLPVSYDFGSDPGKDDASVFTTSGGGTWALAADSFDYETTSGLAVFTATAEFDNLGGSDFTITTTVTNTDVTRPRNQGWFDQFGIIATGDALGNDGFAAVFRYSGNTGATIRFYEGGFNTGTVTDQNWAGSQATDAVYSMTLVGTYVGTDLVLAFTVVDQDGHSQTLDHTLDASLFSGDFAGFGGRAQQRTVVFSDFAIVPEPASLGLLGLAGLGLIRRRQAR